ncbi:MAG: cytochrome c oxidase subunit 3, partial [Longimicrobiales bacterium]
MATAAVELHQPTHPPTATGLNTWKVGFWVFMGSETLFFGSLISIYMVYKGTSVVGPFPSDVFDIPLTSISTFVLLMSSLAVVLALDFLRAGRRGPALFWTMAIIVLGATFLGFQAYEFTHFYHEGLTLQTNLFGSSFFVLTGFHGAHVTLGVIWLFILWLDLLRGQLGP